MMMDPLLSETCWSNIKYFIIILIVFTNYILCICWIVKCFNSHIQIHLHVVTKRDQQLQTCWWHFIHVPLVSWALCVHRTIERPHALPHSFYSRQNSPCLWDTPTLLSTEQSTRAQLKRPGRFDNVEGKGGQSGRESCQLLPDCVHNWSCTATL